MLGESLATDCPLEILQLIPWYLDDGLTDVERGAVEAHAAVCAECRREIHGAFGETDLPPDAPAAERVLAKVFERIAERGRSEPVASPASHRPPPRLGLSAYTHTLRQASFPVASAVAAAVVILGLLFLAPGVRRFFTERSPAYHTAAAPAAARPAAGPELEIVLRGDATASMLNTALRALDAELVAGPTELGRYRVRLPAGADASVAATALRAPETGVASFAEPAP